jgi:hypothetical protein
MGAVAWAMRQRSVSHPRIEPDVPISGIRLSDWFHREAHGEKNPGRKRLLCSSVLSFALRYSFL